MITVHLIAAARPNFMKIAPLYHALKATNWALPMIVHTGQHYDYNMSEAFFEDLQLPEPHFHLGIGSGTHAEQTGQVMIAYEKLAQKERPDLVVVVGDVNSTLACAIASVKLGIRVAHLEAGLRSRDRTMPEEINRILTDAISDILWTPSSDADENLVQEGIPREKIEMVGNIMLDSFEMLRDKITCANVMSELGVTGKTYGVVTLHRPSNVDSDTQLRRLVMTLTDVSLEHTLIFPMHPRTKRKLEEFQLMPILEKSPNIVLCDPQPYIRFMNLLMNATFGLTDSGGIQEETTYLGVPCLTLRSTTERPVTITNGTNRLADVDEVIEQVLAMSSPSPDARQCPELWDGQTAARVVDSIDRRLRHQKVVKKPASLSSF